MSRRRISIRPTWLLRVQVVLPVGACFVIVFMPNLVSTRPPPHSVVASIDSSVIPAESQPRHRFYANDTLLGRSVPCTDEEKECLRYNRIFLPANGLCYPLGDGPQHCRFAVDRYEFEKRGGHVRGYCAPTDLCRPLDSFQVQVAYSGRCMMVRQLIKTCGPGPVNLVQHFFGGTECMDVQSITSPEPLYIPQPETKGRCVFPNLRYDLVSVTNQESRTHLKSCSQEQSECFASKQVYCAEAKGCCDLLKRGPCRKGHRVVLNRTAWEEGRIVAECAPVHPCGSDARLMAFDRKCHNSSSVVRVLCPGAVLLPNAFGEMSCATRDYYRHVIDLKSNRPSSCELTQRVSFDYESVAARLVPECGLSDTGSCVKAFM